MSERNYNLMSMHGITDQDYVDELGAPEELIGKPEINDWIIQKTYEDNLAVETRMNIEEGMDPDKAAKEAEKVAKAGVKVARANLSKVTKSRGY